MPHPDKCSCPTVEDTAGELTRLFSEFIFILANGKCKCSGKNGFTETSNSEGKTRVRNGSAFGKGTNEIKPFMRYTRTQPKGSARSDRSESNRAHVGNKYVGNEGEAVAPDARLLCTTSPISKRAQCGQVRRLIETGDVDTTGLRKESADSYYAHGSRSNPIEDVRKGVASARRTRTTETNACNYSRPSKTVEKKSNNIREHDGSFVLENGSSLDGNGGTLDRTDIKGYSRRGGDLLGKSNEVNENEPLSTVYVRDCDGPRNCRVSGLHETNTPRVQNVLHGGISNGQQNTRNLGKWLWDAFNKKGRNHVAVPGSGSRESNDIRSSEHDQAFKCRKSVKIQCKPSNDGQSARNASCIGETPGMTAELLEQVYSEVPYLKRHSITCARRSSKLATAKDFEIPLHVKMNTPLMDLKVVKGWMDLPTKMRFQNVMDELLHVPEIAEKEPKGLNSLPVSDIALLLKAGIISQVSSDELERRPTAQFIIPFTVVEQDEFGHDRRRFISWSRGDNDRLKDYVPDVPLLHPSKYLHRVDDAIGVKRDLSCGFYQVPLPLAARCKFRFSSKGRTYEMNVLPMGHRCAPEIMHTITSALGGLITVCSAKSAFTRGAMDVYVDGVRFSGTVEQAQEYARFVDKRCDEMGGKFKEKGHEPTQHYVFNGVHYDHVNHKVSLGPRVVRKLQNDRFYSLSFKDLEAAVGRLLYASAVLGIVIPRFHFAVKIVQ